ncbi:MAG: glycosyltransferase family 39 protein, partial [Candidatus Pacearchaeota archaeon]
MNSHLNKIGYLLFLNLSIISGILIALNLFGVIDTKFIASNNIFSAFLIIFLTGMIFCKYNLDEHYHRYNSFARSIVDSSQYFFLSLLILIVANKFLKLDILSDRILILTATAIGFGFLTFYKNRDRVEKEIEDEKQKEEAEEKQRYHDFEYKFQNINRIPILRNIVRWMYKEGWVYVFLLILIITIFTLIKLPYLGYSFTGEHSMKYNSYVEPAIFMVNNHLFFPTTKLFESNPFIGFYGEYDSIGGNLPLTEWGLFFTYKIMQKTSIEISSRLFMILLGSMLLISLYAFYKQIFLKKEAVIFASLVSILPITQLISYLTVADTSMFLFLFISFLFLFKSIKKDSEKLFYTSVLFASISFICKDTSLFFSA